MFLDRNTLSVVRTSPPDKNPFDTIIESPLIEKAT